MRRPAISMKKLMPFAACRPGMTTGVGRQSGFTLVELMVALLLGLVLIGGVLNSFVATRQSVRVNDNLIRIQENSRIAFELMARDIRETGQNPCGAKLVTNVVRSGGAVPWWANWNAGTIQGFNGDQDSTSMSSFGTATNARVTGTDGVMVIRAAMEDHVIVNHDLGDLKIQVDATSGLEDDDILMACDYQSAAIFQVGDVKSSDQTLDYKKTDTEYNCSNNLGYPITVDCTTSTVKVFSPGGLVTPLLNSFWYIGINSSGQRSLFRTKLIKSGHTISISREEILPGVQDLQIQYLTRNVSTSLLANDWVDATASVFDSASGGWGENNLEQVVAIRLDMTLQSFENISTTQTPIQRHMIHVVSLRSRDTLFKGTP